MEGAVTDQGLRTEHPRRSKMARHAKEEYSSGSGRMTIIKCLICSYLGSTSVWTSSGSPAFTPNESRTSPEQKCSEPSLLQLPDR